MDVGQGHKIGFDGGGVGLFEAREGEGTWDELARGRVGGFGRLVRVERAAVVLGRTELVSGSEVLGIESQAQGTMVGHTCWMAECPGSCASGAEDHIWCLALMASRNPSPRGPAIRERQANRWMHIGDTADRQLVRGRCFECACASVMRRSPLVRPWQC